MKNIVLFVLLLAGSTLYGQVGNCDSLTVLDVKLNPFDNTQIMVRSAYTDFDHFITYPGFSLVNDQELVLAWEEVDFFGMSLEQIHQLEILNLDVYEDIPVTATLELWSFNYDYLECTLPGEFLLWPAEECTELNLTFNLLQTDSAHGHIAATLFDSSGALLDSLSFNLDTANALVSLPFCLPKGCDYQVLIESEGVNVEGLTYSLQYRDFLAVGASGTLQVDTTLSHNFDVYGCVFTGGEEPEFTEPQFELFPNPTNGYVAVQFPKNSTSQWQAVSVFTTAGVQVYRRERGSAPGNTLKIDCSAWQPGVYLLYVENAKGSFSTQKLAITR